MDKISRRALLKFAGGSVVGFLFSPMPWKLLDDTAKWSQNWSWIPKPPQGAITIKYNTCTLCQAGCGVRVRCVGDRPVALTGVHDHPISFGAMCPAGIVGHHLPYHPARVTQPLKLTEHAGSVDQYPLQPDELMNDLAKVIGEAHSSGTSVVFVDGQPNRYVSQLYRQLIDSLPNGIYAVSPHGDAVSAALQTMSERPSGMLGYDLEHARTIINFRAPLMDGWGTPGRIGQIIKQQKKVGVSERLKIIHVETRYSRAAAMSDEWIPVNPGADVFFALGLAHVIVREKLYASAVRKTADFDDAGISFVKFVREFSPDVVAPVTGISADKITRTTRELARHTPAVVVGGTMSDEEAMVLAQLNLLLGSVGKTGGVVARRSLPEIMTDRRERSAAKTIAQIPDGSVHLLIVDESAAAAIPWQILEKKLASEKSVVVSIASHLVGQTKCANYVVPSPTYLESLRDVHSPEGSVFASLSVSSPLIKVPAGVIEPASFLQKLAAAAGVPASPSISSPEDLLKKHVDALYRSRRGHVFVYANKETVDISKIESSEQLWKLLVDGGVWIDTSAEPAQRLLFFGHRKENYARMKTFIEERKQSAGKRTGGFPLALMPFRACGDVGEISPLMTKLYQESGLRAMSNRAMINPGTGAMFNLIDGAPAIVSTQKGKMKVDVRFDESVMPSVLFVSAGPDKACFNHSTAAKEENILLLCECDTDSLHCATPANIQKA